MSAEEKRKKFVTLAEKRVTRTIRDIRLIGNLSHKGNYSYTNDDVAKIQRALQEELKKLKSRFAKGGANTEPEFKL